MFDKHRPVCYIYSVWLTVFIVSDGAVLFLGASRKLVRGLLSARAKKGVLSLILAAIILIAVPCFIITGLSGASDVTNVSSSGTVPETDASQPIKALPGDFGYVFTNVPAATVGSQEITAVRRLSAQNALTVCCVLLLACSAILFISKKSCRSSAAGKRRLPVLALSIGGNSPPALCR